MKKRNAEPLAEELTLTPPTIIRLLADSYEDAQRARIGLGNRIWACHRRTVQGESDEEAKTNLIVELIRELDPHSPVMGMGELFLSMLEAEKRITKFMAGSLDGHPVWMAWLSRVKGVGPILACKMLSHIRVKPCREVVFKDPKAETKELIEVDRPYADTISALWRYAGYGVENGERERPAKGERRPYNLRLKTTVFLAGSSFLRANSPYRQFYDSAKAQYEARDLARPTEQRWGKYHRHLAAMRRMNKMFLSHLWLVWREIEGLPVRDPYVEEKLGHTHIVSPWDMVNPEVLPVPRRRRIAA